MFSLFIREGGGLREFSPIWHTLVDWGKYGVDVFFVISGYTIFYQIFHSKYNFKYFLMQRIARISAPYWPLLLLLFSTGVMGVAIVANPWGHDAHGLMVAWENWLLHVLYLNFWNVAYSNTIIGVEWTLSIEVFYYIFFRAILTMTIFRNIFVCFMLLNFTLLCVAVLGFYVMGSPLVGNPLNIYLSPFLYGYMFALGGAAFFVRKKVSEMYSSYTKNRISDLTFVVCLLLFGINLIYSFIPNSPAYEGFFNFMHASFLYSAGLPFFFACLTMLIIAFMQDSSFFGKILNSKPLMFLGSISYSFYLWHFLVLGTALAMGVKTENSLANFFYLLLLTIVISFVWYYLFEKKVYGRVKVMIKRYR